MGAIREVHVHEKLEITVPPGVDPPTLRTLGQRLTSLADDGWSFVRAKPEMRHDQRDGDYATGGVTLHLERRQGL